MKRALASAMALVVLSVIALCPFVICPQTDTDSCCHKPRTHSEPCSSKAVLDCPYSILEKSKTSGATHATWTGAIGQTAAVFSFEISNHGVYSECRLMDFA